MFKRLIQEEEIESVCADLFVSGHCNIAVAEAYKAVDKFIAKKVPSVKHSGTTLMDQVFAHASPHLRWSKLETSLEIDEQKGYQRLYSGAMLGIRNPTTHEFSWVEEPDIALELIIFAQHLIRKAKLTVSE